MPTTTVQNLQNVKVNLKNIDHDMGEWEQQLSTPIPPSNSAAYSPISDIAFKKTKKKRAPAAPPTPKKTKKKPTPAAPPTPKKTKKKRAPAAPPKPQPPKKIVPPPSLSKIIKKQGKYLILLSRGLEFNGISVSKKRIILNVKTIKQKK
tara:strand:- start:5896 stop:6342 length:447 start_codon:yes stop_codon:yes gene_type:complete